jgi:hypothetical protein
MRQNRNEAVANRLLAVNPHRPTRAKAKESTMSRGSVSLAVLVGIFVLSAVMLVGFLDAQMETVAQRQYCRQVAIHKSTDGVLGVPDHKHVFDTQCTPDGGLRANPGTGSQ